ncbi:MAG: hypothetical protein K6G26_00945 [Lachnospiraceae bacterium]|nr:hypothetical protein [Lachnospiraceae bacterium]
MSYIWKKRVRRVSVSLGLAVLVTASITGCSSKKKTSNTGETSNSEESRDVDKDAYENVLNSFVEGINNSDYGKISNITYAVEKVGLSMYWNDVKMKVEKTEVVEDDDDYKLVKFKINVTDPGKSKLKKGINEKYVYFANSYIAEDEEYRWCASPLFDDPENYKKVVYDKVYDDADEYQLQTFGEFVNGGLGFKNEEDYIISNATIDDEVTIDINNDGNKDIVNVEPVYDGKRKTGEFILYVNKGTENEASAKFNATTLRTTKMYFCDIDKEDDFIEVAVSNEDYDIYTQYSFYRYNGKEMLHIDNFENVDENTQSCYTMNIEGIKGDNKIPISVEDDIFIGYFNTYGIVEDNRLKIGEELWEYESFVEEYELKKDLKVYEKPDKGAKTFVIKKGTKCCPKRGAVDNLSYGHETAGWIEIITDDDKKAYIHLCGGMTIENDGKEENSMKYFENGMIMLDAIESDIDEMNDESNSKEDEKIKETADKKKSKKKLVSGKSKTVNDRKDEYEFDYDERVKIKQLHLKNIICSSDEEKIKEESKVTAYNLGEKVTIDINKDGAEDEVYVYQDHVQRKTCIYVNKDKENQAYYECTFTGSIRYFYVVDLNDKDNFVEIIIGDGDRDKIFRYDGSQISELNGYNTLDLSSIDKDGNIKAYRNIGDCGDVCNLVKMTDEGIKECDTENIWYEISRNDFIIPKRECKIFKEPKMDSELIKIPAATYLYKSSVMPEEYSNDINKEVIRGWLKVSYNGDKTGYIRINARDTYNLGKEDFDLRDLFMWYDERFY